MLIKRKLVIVATAGVLLIAATVLASTSEGEKVITVIDDGIETVLNWTYIIDGTDSEDGVNVSDEALPENEYDAESYSKQDPEDGIVTISAIVAGETVELNDELHNVKAKLEGNGYSPDIIKARLIKFSEIENEYSLNSDEMGILSDIVSGDDMNAKLDVFEFLKMTPLEMNALDDIYLMVENDGIPIEEAYSVYVGREDEELTVSDVAYYVNQGISVEEILSMYEITLGAGTGLKTALNDVTEGKSWNEVVADAYGIEGEFAEGNYGLEDILHGVVAARKLNRNFTDIAQQYENGTTPREIEEEIYKKDNLTASYSKNMGKFEDLNEKILQEVKKIDPQIDECVAMKMIEQNLEIGEIINEVKNK